MFLMKYKTILYTKSPAFILTTRKPRDIFVLILIHSENESWFRYLSRFKGFFKYFRVKRMMSMDVSHVLVNRVYEITKKKKLFI